MLYCIIGLNEDEKYVISDKLSKLGYKSYDSLNVLGNYTDVTNSFYMTDVNGIVNLKKHDIEFKTVCISKNMTIDYKANDKPLYNYIIDESNMNEIVDDIHNIIRKETTLNNLIIKELRGVYHKQQKIDNKAKEMFDNKIPVVNDLMIGKDATKLGLIMTELSFYNNAMTILKSLCDSLVNETINNVMRQVLANINYYKKDLDDYTTTLKTLKIIDTEKREIAKTLSYINNNVDVISQRDWYAVSVIESHINLDKEMLSILYDIITIIEEE